MKHIFDDAVRDLARWALHDGWTAEGNALVRLAPTAEEATGIRDKLIDELATSGLDADSSIRDALDRSARAFVADTPDFNASITQARIALETLARRGAAAVALAKGLDYPEDSWGRALHLLKAGEVLTVDEEQILARMYTFVSPGAHVPKGVSHEEWARLARTFAVSSTYFLVRQIGVAL